MTSAEAQSAGPRPDLASSLSPLGYLPIRSPLVGRVKELEFLKAQHDAVAAGAGGRLVFVSGPPGVGKTRLAQELGLYASARGSLVMEGSYLRDGTAAYDPWVRVLWTSLQNFSRDQLMPLIEPFGAELSEVLPEFIKKLDLGPFPPPPFLPPDEQRRRVYDGLVELICSLSQRMPLVLGAGL